MNRLIAIVLMLSLSCQCMVKLGIIAWFGINREYIARNLCENRNKPEMKCCGKCYLKKQLKKADAAGTEQGNAPAKNLKTELLSFVLPAGNRSLFLPFFVIAAIQHPVIAHHFGIPYSGSVFHPPAVSC